MRSINARAGAALLLGAALWTAPAARATESELGRLSQELAETKQELSATKQELSSTKQELAATKSAVGELTRRMDAMQGGAAVAAATPVAAAAPVTETARLAPVNANNPAISFVVDTAFATDTEGSYGSIGFPDGRDFALLNGELFISAPIDPFLRGYASLNGLIEDGLFIVV
jgi:hypothetical protein